MIGTSDGIPIWVPDEDTPHDVEVMLKMQANSLVTQLKRLRNRMRSQVLFSDGFIPTDNWDVLLQKQRVVGEVNCYLQLKLQRKKAKLKVPDDGDMKNAHLGTLLPKFVPESQADLASGDSGRLLAGFAFNSGEVYLAAANSGVDIEIGDTISLGGYYPLDDWLDSELATSSTGAGV